MEFDDTDYNSAAYVTADGTPDTSGEPLDEVLAVRPALWVNISNL